MVNLSEPETQLLRIGTWRLGDDGKFTGKLPGFNLIGNQETIAGFNWIIFAICRKGTGAVSTVTLV